MMERVNWAAVGILVTVLIALGGVYAGIQANIEQVEQKVDRNCVHDADTQENIRDVLSYFGLTSRTADEEALRQFQQDFEGPNC